MKKKNKINSSRRELLKLLGAGGVLSGIAPLGLLSERKAMGAEGDPHRFLQIFANGGWDNFLTTNPIEAGSTHALGGNIQSEYFDGSVANHRTQVTGKSNLFVGAGMQNAIPAFAAIPTAFINGMYVEVTAHELAVAYMLSGKLSLSRSREYPSFVAHLGALKGGFPSHVVLGEPIPLGDTKFTSPPLQSANFDLLSSMLAGPRSKDYYNLTDEAISAAENLISKLNGKFASGMHPDTQNSIAAWAGNEPKLRDLYAKKFDEKLIFDETIKTRYGITGDDDPEARFAGAFMILKEGLSAYVTTSMFGFDTHTGHFGSHLPNLQKMATAINTLISDLQSTPDPDKPEKMLSETTTVLITSEFTRTPLLNSGGGTDHWQVGNAIVMGKGVNDNVNIGAIDTTGNAMGWQGSTAVPYSEGTALLPSHLAASILRLFGYATTANSISEVHLSEIFSS